MNKNLLRRYQKYASTEEARAILFVKEHLKNVQSNWIDIIKYQDMSNDYYNLNKESCFRFVSGRLYKRKLKPKYPPKFNFKNHHNGRFDEDAYYLACRAITWETANIDIAQQKSKNIVAPRFEIKGMIYDKNKHCKGYFIDSAPPEIKALEKNLQDRTNPLWDIALKYANEPKFVFKIKDVRIYHK